ncbi:MAG TPA: AI-2E family transporter [Candidatus Limnocylindria bacterium]|nr:AI-2E family transporter [Candidatus Limnocylindria bacterium]
MNGGEDPGQDRRERWWRSTFIVLATIYVALLLIGLLLRILGGFVQIALVVFVAWLLAFILSPLVGWLVDRLRWQRGLAIGVVYAGTLLLSGFLLFYAAASIGASMEQATDDYPATRASIENTLRTWQAAVSFGRFEPNFVSLFAGVEDTAARIATSALGEVPEVTVAVLGSLVLVIILSLYMLADSAGILAKVNRVVPSRYADEVEILERSISKAFGGFLRAQVLLAAIQTVLTVAVIALVGLPYGFIIAAASALAMLIPFFGPPLALIPPIVATLIFAPEWAIVVAPLLLIVQTVLVNYLQPRLMREALGMHPILVLVGLLVGAQVAGVWGALFGIPVLAVLNVFFNYVVNLRTLEETPIPAEEVLEEVRREAPDADTEEVVALAADRVEESEEAMEAAEAVAATGGAISDDLRTAAGDLRAAADEQRTAAGEMGESATGLRQAVDRLKEERSGEG